jgi:hypothetical protein
MERFGWSYQDLLSAPADMVEEFGERIHQENKWTAERDKRQQAKAKQ